ncbi:MAG TPA: EamA family transporter [Candidatus Cloacimonadota bacterium]|nr:EamA family transporter [Candidatus Cloacimonadota bacterium]HPT72669.1 EamA family transporter [Candidatus Cloacimonadota bacterium]
MQNWFVFALLALLFYGLWGFFPKMATLHLDAKSIIFYESFGIIAIAMLMYFLIPGKINSNVKGITFSILTGICGMVGTLFFLLALKQGKASIIILFTALYPLVSVLLVQIILKESITLRQGLGMLFAVVAIGLFSV